MLYKRSSSGSLLVWSVRAEGDEIVTVYGQEDGAMQEARVRCEATNVGRSNARDPVQQAAFEAVALAVKQVSRKGYVPERDRALAGQHDQASPVLAMLAHRYDKYPKKISFPCYAQRKYDGLRCLASKQDGEVELYSREGKVIGRGLTHLRAALARIPGDFVLDGELDSLTVPFEQIVSFVKSEAPKPGHEVVEYKVYDYPSIEAPFEERLAALARLFLNEVPDGSPLIFVETIWLRFVEEVEPLFLRFKQEGFEGLMLRNSAGLYKAGKRSYDLLKVKFTSDAPFEEREYDIVGAHPGRGRMAECAIFTCTTTDAAGEPTAFDVKLQGSLESLKAYLKDEALWRDKQLTVVYQELTERGVPRFPVGKRVRDRGL